jgi:flagellar basal-body rod protein FlgB
MFQSLDLFRMSGDMARHAAARQTVVATNLANADTPGYRAQAIAPFADVYRAAPTAGMRATRPGHSPGQSTGTMAVAREVRTVEPSPNGNTVSLELEMINAVEAEREHSRALAIYKHAMTVMRAVVSGR